MSSEYSVCMECLGLSCSSEEMETFLLHFANHTVSARHTDLPSFIKDDCIKVNNIRLNFTTNVIIPIILSPRNNPNVPPVSAIADEKGNTISSS